MLRSFRRRSSLFAITATGIIMTFFLSVVLLLFSHFIQQNYSTRATQVNAMMVQSVSSHLSHIEDTAEKFPTPNPTEENIVKYHSDLLSSFRAIMAANRNIQNVLYYDLQTFHSMSDIADVREAELSQLMDTLSQAESMESRWYVLSSSTSYGGLYYISPVFDEYNLVGYLLLCVSPTTFTDSFKDIDNTFSQNFYSRICTIDNSTCALYVPKASGESYLPEDWTYSSQAVTQTDTHTIYISRPLEADGICIQTAISLEPARRSIEPLLPVFCCIFIFAIFLTTVLFSSYGRSIERQLNSLTRELQFYTQDRSHSIDSILPAPVNSLKIRNTIFIMLTLCLMVCSSIAAIFSYNYVMGTVQENYTKSYKEAILSEANSNFSMLIFRANNMYIQLLQSEDFSNAVRDIDQSPKAAEPVLDQVFSDLLASSGIIAAVEYITPDNTRYWYGMDLGDFSLAGDQFVASLSNTHFSFAKDIISYQDHQYNALGRKIYDVSTLRSMGKLLVYFDSTYFNTLFSESTVHGNTFYICVDDVIIAHSDPQYIGQVPYIPHESLLLPQSEDRWNSLGYVVAQYELDNPSLESAPILTCILSNAEIQKNIRQIFIWVLILYLSIVILAFITSYQIGAMLTKYLSQLRDKMHHFNPDTYIPMPKPPTNEVASLVSSFNQMATEIQQLIENVKQEKENQRIAELHALQAQINPHFLYNALGSISWKAKEHRDYEIDDMIVTLSTFLRIGLHNGLDFITVQQEIEHVKCYLEIERIRFPALFTVNWDLDEATFGYRTLKILLQPIIENTIKHGFKGMTSGGIITVKNHIEGTDIVFEVSDNGKGVSLQGSQLPPSTSSDGGYGLFNVNERLTHYYGDDYGIQIQSEPGKGTQVAVRIKMELQRK